MQGSGSKGDPVLYNTWLLGLDWRGKGGVGRVWEGKGGEGTQGEGVRGDVM